MKNEFENLEEDKLAKAVLTDNCCAFCIHCYKLNAWEEYRCCDYVRALEEGLLIFPEDGFANSTRAQYTCKYFMRNHGHKNVYDTSIHVTDEDVSKIPTYSSAIETLKIEVDDKSLKEAIAIRDKNTDDIAKLLANKKLIQSDPDVMNIKELADIAKMATNIKISDFAKKVVTSNEDNPYEE